MNFLYNKVMYKKAAAIYFGSASLLGFYRGCQYYNYDYKSKRKYTNSYSTNENFFYSSCLVEGLIGSIFYVIPVTHILAMCKEIYRLETNFRNLENEKNTEYYYKLI